ncbi:MAG: putative O-glycosylation ligase, exosortase A system-associated [Gammaproteobacteria bacterium]|nr:putative O-glycosylation ligase, exosortase A system-associated [Gammaproteobacteria bacterium]
MRDLFITALVFSTLPLIIYRPWIGVLVWSWLGYMNPHRLAWGFAYNFPFAQVVAVVTLGSILFSKDKKRVPITFMTIVWFLWIFWMVVTTQFALFPSVAEYEFERAMKIQLIAIISLMLMCQKERLIALVWVIVFSLGFYGAKGGIFSLLTGGQYRVWGPEGSFIAGNNSIGLALTMSIPLMWFLYLEYKQTMIRLGMLALIGLTAIAIFTTHSRGAFLAVGSMAVFMWMKSRQKLLLGSAIIMLLPLLFFTMPDSWQDRMFGISEYEEDTSAMGRINAWWMAYYLALDHPFVGGGFGTFRVKMFEKYAPDPDDMHDAHSIYFEVLGEHGFVGIGLFLLLGLLALMTGGWIVRKARGIQELEWARNLAAMLQVSLVAYAVGGTFLGLAYFDLYYQFIAMLALLRVLVTKHLKETSQAPVTTALGRDPPEPDEMKPTGDATDVPAVRRLGRGR